MSGMLVLTAAVSYWISWDMQVQGERLSFARTARKDLVILFAKWRRSVGHRASESRATTPDRVSNSATEQGQVPVRLGTAVLSRS
jgi:hypothetical protein